MFSRKMTIIITKNRGKRHFKETQSFIFMRLFLYKNINYCVLIEYQAKGKLSGVLLKKELDHDHFSIKSYLSRCGDRSGFSSHRKTSKSELKCSGFIYWSASISDVKNRRVSCLAISIRRQCMHVIINHCIE